MSIQWALPMLPQLLPEELMNRIQEASVDPYYIFPKTANSMPVYNGQSGELIKYNKALRNVDFQGEGVMADFEDCSNATGSLIVGADGAQSAVRTCLYGPGNGEAQQVPYGGVNTHICYHDAEIARYLRKSYEATQAMGAHPRGYWLWISTQEIEDPDKPEDWVFQLQWTWRLADDRGGRLGVDLAKLKAEAEECFGEPYKTAWSKIPENTPIYTNRVSVWQPEALPNEANGGRVALAGDAAHAMSFHRGQGMNHGINDAVTLVSELSKVAKGEKTQQEAVLAYDAEMMKRAGEEVSISKVNTEMIHDWERLSQSAFMQRGGDKNK
ncbi:hypothetical protein LTR78_005802 [Recurvomyces mirabilis]|uniref:FAD-binding domain-containing protein n=1 Tax=Recurvomyces mirabilis TaxID=574656 RepID=A0AAE1C0Z4_9PEZI|nr:hypothetical protein LTR78_005802 [Recurvomyces mirabilis]KAK5154182.1 hypothetical protein LTS14_006867 [Recurvomyces mirabilis]